MNKDSIANIKHIKAKYPDALIMCRIDEQYHLIGADAVCFAKHTECETEQLELDSQTIQHLKFPFHSLDIYLPKMVKAGFKVAIAEQLQKPPK